MLSKDTSKLKNTLAGLHMIFNAMNDTTSLCSTSSSPGNQVDGLPGASVDPRRRQATIGIIDMKIDTFDEHCVTMSLRISIFHLICIVMTLSMPSFVENGKCTEEIYSRRNFKKVINFGVDF